MNYNNYTSTGSFNIWVIKNNKWSILVDNNDYPLEFSSIESADGYINQKSMKKWDLKDSYEEGLVLSNKCIIRNSPGIVSEPLEPISYEDARKEVEVCSSELQTLLIDLLVSSDIAKISSLWMMVLNNVKLKSEITRLNLKIVNDLVKKIYTGKVINSTIHESYITTLAKIEIFYPSTVL